MTNCDVCKILQNKELFKVIYDDDICFAILHESPAVLGHSIVIPKIHSPIIEELEDEVVGHLFNVCNKVSSAIFDSLGAHGTNIILNNGIDAGQELPHVVINVLPRSENDGLDFEWTPKKSDDAQIKALATRIKTFSEAVFSGKDNLPEVRVKKDEQIIIQPSQENTAQDTVDDQPKPEKEKTNYLKQALTRMP
jgi:histidine triad (HIT) family protein